MIGESMIIMLTENISSATVSIMIDGSERRDDRATLIMRQERPELKRIATQAWIVRGKRFFSWRSDRETVAQRSDHQMNCGET